MQKTHLSKGENYDVHISTHPCHQYVNQNSGHHSGHCCYLDNCPKDKAEVAERKEAFVKGARPWE